MQWQENLLTLFTYEQGKRTHASKGGGRQNPKIHSVETTEQ